MVLSDSVLITLQQKFYNKSSIVFSMLFFFSFFIVRSSRARNHLKLGFFPLTRRFLIIFHNDWSFSYQDIRTTDGNGSILEIWRIYEHLNFDDYCFNFKQFSFYWDVDWSVNFLNWLIESQFYAMKLHHCFRFFFFHKSF